MLIKITRGKNSDGAAWEEMEVVGHGSESTYPLYECPEDASLERDMISCSAISDWMLLAYKAGVARETFEVITENENE